MEMQGEARIAADRRTVWEALNDPEVLKASIPGCESLERSGDDAFTAKVVLKIGPIKATFEGAVSLSEIDAPMGCLISGEGQGGVAGFARGEAHVRLDAEEPRVTVLRYEVKAHVGGKIAQLGARVVESTAKQLATQFFEAFGRIVEAREPPSTAIEDADAGAVERAEPSPAARPPMLSLTPLKLAALGGAILALALLAISLAHR